MREFLYKFRRHLLVAALIFSAFLLYSWHLRQGGGTTLFERTLIAMAAPFHRGIDLTVGSVSNVWSRYLYLVETEAQNRRLEEENAHFRQELRQLEEIRLANDRLRELLEFKELTETPTLPAQVIAEDITPWMRTVMIDKGLDHGVHEGAAVVVSDGVVGRIIKVSRKRSRVLLVTDASSAVAALVQKTRTRGVCRGDGEDLQFNFVLRRDQVQIGDRVVTSGLGGVFPKGLFLGEVVHLENQGFGLFQNIVVRPAVDFSRLEEVLVLLPGES